MQMPSSRGSRLIDANRVQEHVESDRKKKEKMFRRYTFPSEDLIDRPCVLTALVDYYARESVRKAPRPEDLTPQNLGAQVPNERPRAKTGSRLPRSLYRPTTSLLYMAFAAADAIVKE